jgi:hypothetical protein
MAISFGSKAFLFLDFYLLIITTFNLLSFLAISRMLTVRSLWHDSMVRHAVCLCFAKISLLLDTYLCIVVFIFTNEMVLSLAALGVSSY